jgi:hypothetical protein
VLQDDVNGDVLGGGALADLPVGLGERREKVRLGVSSRMTSETVNI